MTYQDMTVRQFLQSLRDGKYAWPGGYPKYWLASDGETLSYEACREQCMQIARAIRDNDNSGWRVVACDANWEDPAMYCAHTNERIESAYAEDQVPHVYTTHYVHKVSNPNGPELGENVSLTADMLADKSLLAKALREQGALLPGARIYEYRVEQDGKVCVFPTLPGLSTYHHCIILTPFRAS
jgi:hypothetical protein